MKITEAQRRKMSEAGRKGGLAKVPKGFARIDSKRLKEIGAIGGKKSRRGKAVI